MMHIFSMKSKTKKMKIRHISDAPILFVPLCQHIGKPAEIVVKEGETVKKYQLIGKASNGLSANIHSPVSGKILEIRNHQLADGTETPTIIIENDFKENEAPHPSIDYKTKTPDELVDIIADSGIVGEGGAQFPTAFKYRGCEQRINTFIINGTECEPYLSADYALMNERTARLFEGIHIVNSILGASNIVISIERQNKELIKVFDSYLKKEAYKNIKVKILPNEYPQGGELQLIRSVTGIEIPRNRRPYEYGVIVSNVGTICAIYQAVANSKPLISRIITISGKASGHEGNYEVKIGTPISHILQSLNISPDDKNIILGGPMMGKKVENLSAPIIKGSSGVLFFKKEEIKRNNCISCGYCVDVCPMHLMPLQFAENYRRGHYLNLEKYKISSCIECAACEYICPSNVPLMESIKEGKIKLKQLANAIE